MQRKADKKTSGSTIRPATRGPINKKAYICSSVARPSKFEATPSMAKGPHDSMPKAAMAWKRQWREDESIHEPGVRQCKSRERKVFSRIGLSEGVSMEKTIDRPWRCLQELDSNQTLMTCCLDQK